MAAIGPDIPCWGYFYSARAEPYNRIRRYVCAILQVQKKTLAFRGEGVRSAGWTSTANVATGVIKINARAASNGEDRSSKAIHQKAERIKL